MRLARPTRKPRLSIVLLPLRNSPTSRFNVRRAANCLPPRAVFAWRASTPLILLRSPGRKRWRCQWPARRARNPRPEPVRFPWRIFFAVLGISFLLALISKDSGGNRGLSWQWEEHRPLPVSGCFLMRSGGAFPRPLRWAVGSMLLPVVIFPWYLARRSSPKSPVPFVEAEVGPVTRFLLFALLIFFLASLIFYIVQGPPPRYRAKHPRPKDAQDRRQFPSPELPTFACGRLAGGRRWPGEGSRPKSDDIERSGRDQRAIRCPANVNLGLEAERFFITLGHRLRKTCPRRRHAPG